MKDKEYWMDRRLRCRPQAGTRRLWQQAGALTLLSALALIPLTGCGGGGGTTSGTTSTPTPTPTPTAGAPVAAKVTIAWNARSRSASRDTSSTVLIGPTAALSAVITLQHGKVDGGDLVWTADRDTAAPTSPNPAAQQETYTAGDLAQPGKTYPLIVQFYAQADGQGKLVSSATATVTVANDGTVTGAYTPSSAIAKIILPTQTIPIGQPADLAFQALDAGGNDLHITPGSVYFLLLSGSANLQLSTSGAATGLKPGTATVSAFSDLASSVPTTVTVVSNAVVAITPATGPTITYAQTQPFTATVAPVPPGADPGVTWTIVDGAGKPITDGSAGTIDAKTGLYTAPQHSGTFTVQAKSVYDPSKTATAKVTVIHPIVVTPNTVPAGLIQNGQVDVIVNHTVTFTAATAYVPDGQSADVTWSVVTVNGTPVTDGSAGTIDAATGLYTAPTTRGTYYVQATSNFDPTASARVQINVRGATVPIVVQ